MTMFEGFEQLEFRARETIFLEGEEGDCAFLIESGAVAISTFKDGRQHLIGLLGEGDIFGEMALVDQAPRTASASAVTQTRLLRIPRRMLYAELSKGNSILEHLLRLILKRFRDLHYRLGDEGKLMDQDISEEAKSAFSSSRANVIEYVQFASEIEKALSQDEFELYSQPIVTIADGTIAGFEALIRWHHPQHGLRPPGRFLTIAEYTSQILPIGIWTVERACRDLLHLLRAICERHGEARPLFISINLSAPQLMHMENGQRLADILHAADLSPASIKLEITETAMFDDPERAKSILDELEALGFQISLDDFGTGYSSLSYLQRFPVDDIKIDRSFVAQMLTDPSSMQIVRGAIGLARALELKTTAEGVGQQEAIDHLRRLGCSYAQGYFYAKPLKLDDAVAFIRQHQTG